MAKPYDAATRLLTETRPEDWVTFLNLPPGAVTLLDADLSTVTLAADRIVRVDAPVPYLMHLEFESGKDTSGMPFRLQQYSINISGKYDLAVVSVVFLLRRASDSPQITGIYERFWPDGARYDWFRYRVVRVWELDVETLLAGGLSLLPLAPVANVTPEQLPGVIDRMIARVEAEIPDDAEAGQFWTAVYILMGLRYNKAVNAQVLRKVRGMRESVTYQAILDEGREEGIEKGQLIEARRMVLRAGARRLGPAPATAQTALDAVSSLGVLERMFDRVFDVETWDELLRPLT